MALNIIREVHEANGHIRSDKLEILLKRDYDIHELRNKMQFVINNCIPCLVTDRKRGKIDGLLHSIPKDDQPLQTFHADHLGPMTQTDKKYQYIFVLIDSFSKFCWLFPTKTTATKEVIEKLLVHQQTFGNPIRLITDKGTAFTSNQFKEYCHENLIEHITITTGVPRGNGQVEKLNQVIISVLTKLSIQDAKKWYRHIPKLQMILNSTYQKAIKSSPYEVLLGVNMHKAEDLKLLELLNEETQEKFALQREEIRNEAKTQILSMQHQNQQQYNKKAKKAPVYFVGDLVFIKRTQFGSGLKLKGHFLGPYKVTNILPFDRYEVEKVGQTWGPVQTSTSADFMKKYIIRDE